jgi:hypothetical protein
VEKIVRRYSAFIPRWCQAFGDHQPDPGGEGRAVEWLIGEDSVGEILAPKAVEIEFGPRSIRFNRHDYEEASILRHAGYAALRELLLGEAEVHMYLTYHLIYPPGTRIITLSRKAPLPLLYKKMAPLPLIVSG